MKPKVFIFNEMTQNPKGKWENLRGTVFFEAEGVLSSICTLCHIAPYDDRLIKFAHRMCERYDAEYVEYSNGKEALKELLTPYTNVFGNKEYCFKRKDMAKLSEYSYDYVHKKFIRFEDVHMKIMESRYREI